MAGPSLHGQRNKKHKSGRQAGASARDKHKAKKASDFRNGRDASAQAAMRKADRMASMKHSRDKKRADVLAKRRRAQAPQVVGLLPLSSDVDAQGVWDQIISAAESGGQHGTKEKDAQGLMESDTSNATYPMIVKNLEVASRKFRMTLLPPPPDRNDPLALVELLKAVDVLILAVPGNKKLEAVDSEGRLALDLLGSLGVTSLVGLVPGAADSTMKARAAAKKHGEQSLTTYFAGEHKLLNFDNSDDSQQLLRYLAEHTPTLPTWRQQRPSVMVQDVDYQAATASGSSSCGGKGTLALTGFVRCCGLSANQNLHVPGVGDFQIHRIEELMDSTLPRRPMPVKGADDDTTMGGDTGNVQQVARVIEADPETCEPLDRENIPNPLEGEQTWPTEEELREAEEAAGTGKQRRRRLPRGTSDYQAAWILDDDDYADEAEEDEDGDAGMDDGDEADSDGGSFDDDDDDGESSVAPMEEETEDQRRANMASMKLQRAAADDDYPDEVDTPFDVAARIRFDKYRGLKSFRTSPWDTKESLPQEYSRVFAFQNVTRAHKRAAQLQQVAGSDTKLDGVASGYLVRIHLSDVPEASALKVLERLRETTEKGRPPLMTIGLMQHECKLSVLHFLVKKSKGYEDVIANKEELIFCTGLRTFSARAILSQNGRADKHKMERFLRDGEYMIVSCYGPITYPQLPLLLFKAADPEAPLGPARRTRLAAVGSLHSTNPDRIIVKKIVLSGYPVRVHKKKATIKYMFHNPEDIKWFKPVELVTKYGRRGRIKEPIGDHGTMKCVFDGPVQQRDSVCMSLYKRVFPKWPTSMDFA